MSILFGCGLVWGTGRSWVWALAAGNSVTAMMAGEWSVQGARRMTQSCLTRRVQQGRKRLQPYRCRWESGCHVGYWFRVDQIRDNQECGTSSSLHVSLTRFCEFLDVEDSPILVSGGAFGNSEGPDVHHSRYLDAPPPRRRDNPCLPSALATPQPYSSHGAGRGVSGRLESRETRQSQKHFHMSLTQ